jgi:hypothetical protein
MSNIVAQAIIDLHDIARKVEQIGDTKEHGFNIRKVADALNEWHKASLVERHEMLKYKDDLK